MSKHEDDISDGNELKAYLGGEDGISATYRQAGTEEPPAELDRLILAAARKAVQQEASGKTAGLQRKFSLAASFMIGILVTSLYFNRENEFAEEAVSSAAVGEVNEQVLIRAAEQAAPVLAPAAPAAAIGAASPEPLAPAVARQAAQFAEQAAGAAASTSEEQAEQQQSKSEVEQRGAFTDNLAALTGTAVDTSAGARENAGRAAQSEPGAAAAAAPPGVQEAPAEADAAGVPPEETSVTGSRIAADSGSDLRYRQTRDEWLAEILALREQAIIEADQLEAINTRMEEELELFSATYPDFDLDAQLQTLEAE